MARWVGVGTQQPWTGFEPTTLWYRKYQTATAYRGLAALAGVRLTANDTEISGVRERSLLYFLQCKAFFLADRTNGRAYATVLRLSVCLSSVRLSVCLWRYVLWLNGVS